MTRIRLGILKPAQETTIRSSGVMVFQPTKRLTDEVVNLILPQPFSVVCDGTKDEIVDLMPTGPDWCWMATERFGSYVHRRWLIIPDSVQILDYATLSEVDWQYDRRPNPPIAHSVRAINRELAEGDEVDFADIKPNDNINVGDIVVDANSKMWLIGTITESKAIIGGFTGVQLGSEGRPGKDGLSFRSGTGDPNALQVTGIIGDTYMDVSTGNLYKLNS